MTHATICPKCRTLVPDAERRAHAAGPGGGVSVGLVPGTEGGHFLRALGADCAFVKNGLGMFDRVRVGALVYAIDPETGRWVKARVVRPATIRTPEEEYERRFDQDMAAREGELRDLAAEREEDE